MLAQLWETREKSNTLECGGLAPLWPINVSLLINRKEVRPAKAAPGRRTPRSWLSSTPEI
jgi:hypothetical protein